VGQLVAAGAEKKAWKDFHDKNKVRATSINGAFELPEDIVEEGERSHSQLHHIVELLVS
jgi:hypothetical protein